MHHAQQKIIVLDFGSQYTQLIARRIRESRVYSEIHPYTISLPELRALDPQGIILSGAPASVYDPDAPIISTDVFDLGVPVLGICYGMQLISHLQQGTVQAHAKREYGRAELVIDNTEDLFGGFTLNDTIPVWMSHGDRVTTMPAGFEMIAHSAHSPCAAIRNRERRIYGVQFHPEVAHTPQGTRILENFIFAVCACAPTWTMRSFIDFSIEHIRETVGAKRVLCGCSGGVDSTVAAVLIDQAIGEQLSCIFVDHGLLRKNEFATVTRLLRDTFKISLTPVEASERFLNRLADIDDPETKRKIIGHEFIAVFEQEAAKLGTIDFLAQGTVYPDVIESISVKGPAATIKSHHNVGGLPERMQMKLLEPFRELFKDEVREIGRELGIPEEAIIRQPFPGPGLAVRIVGAVNAEDLKLLRESDTIILEEFKRSGWYSRVWQSFAVLLPIKTVGVMGDKRTYEKVIALRVVDSRDAMTADWVDLPRELLSTISNRIINEVPGINRVVYDISSKPPSTIEWE